MKVCNRCTAEIKDCAAFCPNCGTPCTPETTTPLPNIPPQYGAQPPCGYPRYGTQQNYGYAPYGAQPPYTAEAFDPTDIQSNKLHAVLAYLGILVLVPLLAAKHSPFARYHTNQGLVLLIVNTVLRVLLQIAAFFTGFLSSEPVFSLLLGFLSWALVIGINVLMILGVVHAATGAVKPLPLIGSIQLLK